MQTDVMNFTVEELDELCRLYMDCKLSVLEEKELEYVLSHTSMTSQAIEEVRNLMRIQGRPPRSFQPDNVRRSWNWRLFSGIAASVAVMLSVAFYFISPQDSLHSPDSDAVYIAAYSNGQRLSGREAEVSTTMAMAKADSLMNYAYLVEHANMQKANEIISETFNK